MHSVSSLFDLLSWTINVMSPTRHSHSACSRTSFSPISLRFWRTKKSLLHAIPRCCRILRSHCTDTFHAATALNPILLGREKSLLVQTRLELYIIYVYALDLGPRREEKKPLWNRLGTWWGLRTRGIGPRRSLANAKSCTPLRCSAACNDDHRYVCPLFCGLPNAASLA